MAVAPASTQKSASRGARLPRVNLFDMPELLPGAQPSANPAQREGFEQRCRQLHRDEAEEACEAHEAAAIIDAAAGAKAAASDLEAMFPNLDPGLVRAIHGEAQMPQQAIETLLALSAAVAEPVGSEGTSRPVSSPPRNLGVDDPHKFPSLLDSDGWQVVSQKQLEQDPDAEPGSEWRDRAKAAADMPAPRPAPAATAPARGQATRRRGSSQKEEEREPEQPLVNEYELRQSAGERRVQLRTQYGRSGRGAAAAHGSGHRAEGRGVAAGSEVEAPEGEPSDVPS